MLEVLAEYSALIILPQLEKERKKVVLPMMISMHLDFPAKFCPEEGIMNCLIGVKAEENIAGFCTAKYVGKIGILKGR